MKSVLVALLAVGMMAPAFAGRLQLNNNTGGYAIYYVYISPATSDSWGSDWLGSSEIINSGSGRSFNVTNGTYDVKLIDEDGDEYIVWDMPISGTVTWNVTLSDLGQRQWTGGSGSSSSSSSTAPVTIYNGLGNYDIYYIYCDASDQPWGNNRLGSEILRPRRSFSFNVPANDYYDIKCVDVDGDTYTLWQVYIDSSGFRWDVTLGDMD